MKRSLLITSFAALAVCAAPHSGSATDFPEGQCMTVQNERKDGPIKEMAVNLKERDDGDQFIFVSFTEWDVPNTRFDTRALCGEDEGGTLFCSIDCDGGSVTVSEIGKGEWRLDFSALNYDLIGADSLFAAGHPDAGRLRGTFIVKKDTERKLCQVKPDYVFVALEPGDISPRVLRAEQLLNKLGQLLEFPDTIYDDATADAVRAFQRRYGLSVTGSIDEATSAALVSAGFAGGGC